MSLLPIATLDIGAALRISSQGFSSLAQALLKFKTALEISSRAANPALIALVLSD
ncbi:MAG: hypothetical protein JWM16_3497 [Verrucomicrobiales bacterium]|nr:hypothetical protein [Verrucomicrobiales bacterium]